MNNFRLEQRGCAPAAVGQGTQSALRCILINLLMRLYPLAAREGKKEAFMAPPELCAHVVLLISHISSLFFSYPLSLTCHDCYSHPLCWELILGMGQETPATQRFKRLLKRKEVLYTWFYRCSNEDRSNLFPQQRDSPLSIVPCM